MTEFVQQADETPRAWLTRLAEMDEKALTAAQRRARAGCLAEARRLSQEEQQQARWAHDRK